MATKNSKPKENKQNTKQGQKQEEKNRKMIGITFV